MARILLMRVAEVAPMMVALGPVAGIACLLTAFVADLRPAAIAI